MCAPPVAAALIMAAATTAATTGTLVMANQATQHAKGAAEAQAAQAAEAAKKSAIIGPAASPTAPVDSAAIGVAQDDARRRAALRSGFMSTIATSPGGILGTSSNAPKAGAGKTTLGA